MKTSKLLITAIAATAFLFTACTADEEDYAANRELVFQVGMNETHGTRATTDNSWSVGDYIAVKVGGVVKKYVITDASGKAVGADAANTFYWEEMGVSSVQASAWSFGGKYVSSIDGEITIESDQSSYDNFKANDFIYAKETTIEKGKTGTLTFYHQMARLNFNIRVDDESEFVNGMTIGGLEQFSTPLKKATFQYPDQASNYGSFVFNDETMVNAAVTPYKEETPLKGYDASYSAILIPISVEGIAFTIKTSDGKQETSYLLASWSLLSTDPDDPYAGLYLGTGFEYTVNITIRNKELIIGNGKDAVTVADWIE